MWPVTSQSKSMRSAARDCLTVGGENSPWRSFTKAATWKGLHVGELADAVCVAPLREAPGGVQVRLARVAVVDLGGKKLEDALRGLGRWREQRRGIKLSAWGDEDFGGRGEPASSVTIECDKGRYHTLN